MPHQGNSRNGGRESTSNAYIKPAMKRSNLHVLTMAHVLKVRLNLTRYIYSHVRPCSVLPLTDLLAIPSHFLWSGRRLCNDKPVHTTTLLNVWILLQKLGVPTRCSYTWFSSCRTSKRRRRRRRRSLSGKWDNFQTKRRRRGDIYNNYVHFFSPGTL